VKRDIKYLSAWGALKGRRGSDLRLSYNKLQKIYPLITNLHRALPAREHCEPLGRILLAADGWTLL
jgi:hypothetical protein